MTGLVRALSIIVIIGAINWGLIGLFNWNLVDAIFGGGATETTSTVSRVIYTIVGIAGVALLTMLRRLFAAERRAEPLRARGTSRREDVREPPRPQV